MVKLGASSGREVAQARHTVNVLAAAEAAGVPAKDRAATPSRGRHPGSLSRSKHNLWDAKKLSFARLLAEDVENGNHILPPAGGQ
jgi:hypothetical protein